MHKGAQSRRSSGRAQTPKRVASRMEGVVKNRGTKPTKKASHNKEVAKRDKVEQSHMRDSFPKVGKVAPLWSSQDQNGETRSLKEYRGSWVLLYFYPKDNTTGCTKEACMLRDTVPNFKKLSAKVVGVSIDSVKSHKKFETDHGLTFTLISDESKTIVNLYGVWAKKKMMGREYMGTLRTSFLITPEGKIAKVYPNVDPATHAEEVVDDLKSFRKAVKKG